jgi:hypothetical protein
LFVAQDVYDWRLHDELGIAAFWAGDYATGKAACETVLQRVEAGLDIGQVELDRVRANMAYSVNKLAEIAKSTEDAKKK